MRGVGFFGTYLFEAGRWSETGDTRVASEPWLFLNIYDSDIATVMYRPSGSATGMAFLGITPRSYFDTDSASPPSDVNLEARGLASWWALMNPGAGEAERAAKEAEVRRYLAPDTAPYDLVDGEVAGLAAAGDAAAGDADEGDADEGDADEGDVLVEIKAARFLTALGLPLPDDLRR